LGYSKRFRVKALYLSRNPDFKPFSSKPRNRPDATFALEQGMPVGNPPNPKGRNQPHACDNDSHIPPIPLFLKTQT
jgi:hypothetical protein